MKKESKGKSLTEKLMASVGIWDEEEVLSSNAGSDRRRCLSVYHEGVVADLPKDDKAYYVRGGRYGGWYGYAGESRVIWGDFRYGWCESSRFISLVRGECVATPGSYGMRSAVFDRIDVYSKRPFSAIYQMERRRDGALTKSLCDSLVFVVHHFVDENVETWSSDYRMAIVVRGSDYPFVDWAKAEKAMISGKDLPDFVVCWGSPDTVEDFLVNVHGELKGGKRISARELKSRRWRVDISHPAVWKRWFCEKHDRIDTCGLIYEDAWTNATRVIEATQDLVLPYDSETTRGLCVGIREEDVEGERRFVLTFVVENARRSDFKTAKAFFGPYAGVMPVVGDAVIQGLREEFDRTPYAPAFAGSLDCERFYS